MLSNFVVDKKVSGRTSIPISGLDEGTYYWMVSSIDSKGVESQPSQANRLNLVQEVAGNQAYLEVTKIIQHGKVVEVQGKTEPGSRASACCFASSIRPQRRSESTGYSDGNRGRLAIWWL